MPYKQPNDEDVWVAGAVVSRTCTKCKQHKDIHEFHKSAGPYRRRTCKACADARRKELAALKDPLETAARSRAHHLRTKYGISVDEFDKLWDAQDGKCQICSKAMSNNVRVNEPDKVQIDHCHDTGRVRGLLCFSCNTGIGKLQDSVELLEKAIDYLKNPPEVIYRDKSIHPDEESRGKWAKGKIRVDYDAMNIPRVQREKPRGFTDREKRIIVQEYGTGTVSMHYLAIRWGTYYGAIQRIISESKGDKPRLEEG